MMSNLVYDPAAATTNEFFTYLILFLAVAAMVAKALEWYYEDR